MSADVSDTFEIVNQLGMHARAATKLVQLASRYKSDIEIEKDGHVANAKSVMGVLLLCGHQGSRVRIHARGDDAPQALNALGELIRGKFGEPA